MTLIQIRGLLPSIIFYGMYDLQKRWLSCQRITFMPMVAMFVAIFIHIILCYLFMNVFEMDIIGLAYATSIKDAVLALSVAIYCYCSEKISKSLTSIGKESFSGWK